MTPDGYNSKLMGAKTQSSAGPLRDIGLPERYPIVRRVASGGMASVWCAQDVVLGRRVAIKLLAEQFLGERGAVLRFKREARAAARLSGHPHVVTIFDVGETASDGVPTPGRPFIVMEYLAGGTVADAMRVGEISHDELLRWLHEAASALDFAHGRGVVHRDIKPANLLLDEARVLHVGDFGIARVGTEDTITSGGELFGTAAYLAPEQALGHPATEAGDRYALAVVAYELLVGQRPFVGENFAVQARQHVEEPPPRASARNPALPASVDPVLERGMAKRPEERFSTASEFVDALQDALEGDAMATRPLRAAALGAPAAAAARAVPAAAESEPPNGPIFTRVSGERRRPRPRAIAFGALLAAVAALAVAIIAGSGGSPRPSTATQATAGSGRGGAAHHRTRPAVRHSPPPATSTSAAAPTTSTPTTPTPPPASAAALQAQGHNLLASGNAAAAVGVLRQAVAAASPSSLTYAYALYDLGASLLQSGNPRAAAVVLQRRLQIPNQTEVVRQELQSALRQLGAQVNASGGAPAAAAPGVPPGHQPGHGHGQGHGQGDNSD